MTLTRSSRGSRARVLPPRLKFTFEIHYHECFKIYQSPSNPLNYIVAAAPQTRTRQSTIRGAAALRKPALLSVSAHGSTSRSRRREAQTSTRPGFRRRHRAQKLHTPVLMIIADARWEARAHTREQEEVGWLQKSDRRRDAAQPGQTRSAWRACGFGGTFATARARAGKTRHTVSHGCGERDDVAPTARYRPPILLGRRPRSCESSYGWHAGGGMCQHDR